MALVSWHGLTVSADPIQQLDNGDWLMKARSQAPRLDIGAPFRVALADIIEMASAEMPETPVPVVKDHSMSKLSQLAALAADTSKAIDADADRSFERLNAARAKAKAGIAKLDDFSATVERGIADIEDMANQLTNGGPPLVK